MQEMEVQLRVRIAAFLDNAESLSMASLGPRGFSRLVVPNWNWKSAPNCIHRNQAPTLSLSSPTSELDNSRLRKYPTILVIPTAWITKIRSPLKEKWCSIYS